MGHPHRRRIFLRAANCCAHKCSGSLRSRSRIFSIASGGSFRAGVFLFSKSADARWWSTRFSQMLLLRFAAGRRSTLGPQSAAKQMWTGPGCSAFRLHLAGIVGWVCLSATAAGNPRRRGGTPRATRALPKVRLRLSRPSHELIESDHEDGVPFLCVAPGFQGGRTLEGPIALFGQLASRASLEN